MQDALTIVVALLALAGIFFLVRSRASKTTGPGTGPRVPPGDIDSIGDR